MENSIVMYSSIPLKEEYIKNLYLDNMKYLFYNSPINKHCNYSGKNKYGKEFILCANYPHRYYENDLKKEKIKEFLQKYKIESKYQEDAYLSYTFKTTLNNIYVDDEENDLEEWWNKKIIDDKTYNVLIDKINTSKTPISYFELKNIMKLEDNNIPSLGWGVIADPKKVKLLSLGIYHPYCSEYSDYGLLKLIKIF